MKTSRTYRENLKKGIITTPMLVNSLFRLNKWAKNCFDAIKDCEPVHWQSCTDKWEYINGKKNKLRKCNSAKESLLSFLKSHCTHDNHGSPVALELAEPLVTYRPYLDEPISLNFIAKEVKLIKSGTFTFVDAINNYNASEGIDQKALTFGCAA